MSLFSGLMARARVPENARSIVLIARSRSGTTVFRALLDTHPEVQTFGEIFNEGNEDSYYHYLHSRIGRDPKLIFPSHSAQNFSDYVKHLQSVGARRKPTAWNFLFDLKYALSRHLVKPWQMFMAPPYIFERIREERFGVIHLVRRNHLRMDLSNRLMILRDENFAGLKGKYHFWANDKKAQRHLNEIPSKVKLGSGQHLRGELLDYYRRLDEETDCIRRTFGDSDDYLELCYEDLFETDGQTQRFSPSVIEKTGRYLGIEDRFDVKPKILKATPQGLDELIENYEEVAKALEGTDYAWFLGEGSGGKVA